MARKSEILMENSMQAEIIHPDASDIVLAIEQSPKIALLDAVKYDAFYQRIKAETEKLVADTSTSKGRDEIRSMAAKVTKAKTGIDKARLALTAEWRDQTKQVNEAGKKIEADLDALAAEVRKPLTDWEDAEKSRKDRCRAIIDSIKVDMVVSIDDTADAVRERGKRIYAMSFPDPDFAGFAEEATGIREQAIEAFKAALARLTKEEADRAELERLRTEQAERDAREAAEREARETKERAEREAAEAEQRRLAAEKSEQDRLARVAAEAEERAKREAERAAEAERERIQREHEAALAAERRRAEEAEAAAKAERDRIAAEKAAEAARIKAEEEARTKREADQKHRTAIKTKAKEAIMSCGADEETAKKIVLAIIAGEVPAVRLEF